MICRGAEAVWKNRAGEQVYKVWFDYVKDGVVVCAGCWELVSRSGEVAQ